MQKLDKCEEQRGREGARTKRRMREGIQRCGEGECRGGISLSVSQRKRQDLQERDSRAGVGKGPVIFPVPPQGQWPRGSVEG